MQKFHRTGSKNLIQELRPIKIELGGLTTSNLFSKQTIFNETQDEIDFDESERLNFGEHNIKSSIQEDDQNENETYKKRKVNFEPDPEDDNHLNSKKGSKTLIHLSNKSIQILKLLLCLIEQYLKLILTQKVKRLLMDSSNNKMHYFKLLRIQVITIIYDYRIDLQLKIAQKFITKHESVWSTKMAYFLILEILCLIPHPNSICKGKKVSISQSVEDIVIVQEINDFFCIWMLIRIYLLLRAILNHSVYSSTRAKRICRMIGCDSGHFYSIKCIFREEPLTATTFLFILSVLIYGHALRVAEKILFDMIPSNTQNFGNYINCFWCVIITMSTVGYGDYYPKSLPGRIVIILAAITGVVLISILVVSLTLSLNMSIAEKKTHHVIKRLKARKSLMDKASNVLTKAAKFKVMVDSNYFNKTSKQKGRLNDIKKDIIQFRDLNRKIKNMYDNSNQSEEMYRQFDFLKSELKQIYENQNKLREYLLKIKTNLNQNDFEEPSLFNMSEYHDKDQ